MHCGAGRKSRCGANEVGLMAVAGKIGLRELGMAGTGELFARRWCPRLGAVVIGVRMRGARVDAWVLMLGASMGT